jgi:tetratricopeptide (TPR) repeat protein
VRHRTIGFLLLAGFVATGCAEIRLSRLKPALEADVRSGRLTEATRTELEILRTADEGFGPESIDTTRTRVTLAKSYAQWGLSDRALALAQETVDQLDPQAANQAIVPALIGLADVQLYTRQYDSAERTTDRLVSLCDSLPPHVPTIDDPYDECHFARYSIPDLFRGAGAFEKFAREYLAMDGRSDPHNRESGLSKLTVLGRGYSQYGAYAEATWYFQRCVDENRPRYESRDAPSAERKIGATSSGDVQVFALDWAHSFHSQSPRCLEDLIRMRRLVGDDAAADDLERWQRDLWAHGPDLEAALVESMRKSDRIWHDGYNTSHDASNLAFYYANKGRTHEAIRVYEEGIALIDEHRAREGVFGGVLPIGMMLDEMLSLGALYEKAGRAGDAVAVYARAVSLADELLPPRHTYRVDSRAGLARAMQGAGRQADSESAWREYLRTLEAIRGSDHPEYAIGLDGLAATREDRDRRESHRLRDRAAQIRTDARRRVSATRHLPLPVALRSSPPPAN